MSWFGNSKRIKILQEKVAKLEKPYKFEIGERVESYHNGLYREGIIVDRRYTCSDFNCGAVLYNYYLIYSDELKDTNWFNEHSVSKKNDKPLDPIIDLCYEAPQPDTPPKGS